MSASDRPPHLARRRMWTLATCLSVVLILPDAHEALAQQRKGVVSQDLLRLEAEYRAGKRDSVMQDGGPVTESIPVFDGHVPIDAASQSPQALLAELEALGMKNGAVYGFVVSGLLPVSAIGELSSLPNLRLVRAALLASNAGAVTSQGDPAMRSDAARVAFGVDGTGVTVGTISDSYNALGGPTSGAYFDIGTGDLPPEGVVVLEDLSNGTDEGRAMMQIIHDVAPGARLGFSTGFGGMAHFALAIEGLAGCPPGSAPGCTPEPGFSADIINDDLFYYDEPFFQDGIIAQAVDHVVKAGVVYFSSAGNSGREAYHAPFRGSGVIGGMGGELHDFDPGDGVDVSQRISIPVYKSVRFVFQWADRYLSVSGVPGAESALKFILRDETGYPRAASYDSFVGGDPIEGFNFTNPGIDKDGDGELDTEFDIQIELSEGPYPRLMKYVAFVGGAIDNLTVEEYDTQSGTVVGHSNSHLGIAVGGAAYYDTPAFGVSPPVKEPFSAAGSTPIYYDVDGNFITPTVRPKPDLTAPHRGNTTFFGSDSDDDGWPNFSGTSASAPHAAGVAALLIEAAGGPGSLSPSRVLSALESTAIDMDDPLTPGFDVGFDFATGYGLIDAYEAIRPYTGPRIALDVLEQSVHYGDQIATVTITASDSGAGDLDLGVWWVSNRSFGTFPPDALEILPASGACGTGPDGGGTECIWTLQGKILEPESEVHLHFTVTDEDGLSGSAETVINVLARPVAVAFSTLNPVAIQVVAAGGASGPFSIVFQVSGFLVFPGIAGKAGIAGGTVSASLSPVGPGSAYASICNESDLGEGIVEYDCPFDAVEVNTYTVDVTVKGDGFYAGAGEDVLAIHDPSLGFTTGGGSFIWPGSTDRTNFGFNVGLAKGKGRSKTNKTPQAQGSLLLIRHIGGVEHFRLKSNAMSGLAVGTDEDALGTFGWSSFFGKATYREPGWDEAEGNYQFLAYVEDRGEAGTHADRFWIEVRDPATIFATSVSMPRDASDEAVPILGGNIQVPHGGTAGKAGDLAFEDGESSVDMALPSDFAMAQNYPNPFNPITVIRYQAPEAAHVRIAVFDLAGREITRLVDSRVAAGYHEVTWDGGQFASGVYIYRMTGGAHVMTRRMVLIK